MKVSLYIPCYNAASFIGECLDGVLRQTADIYEVIIVDDGSSDESVKIASKYGVRIISHEKNMGLSAARNTAIKNSNGELIASLDVDCVPDGRWLESLLDEFTDGKVGGAGGMLVEGNRINPADLWRSLNMPQHWGEKRIQDPEFLFGSNNVFRKDLLLGAGMYNEALGNNGEDYDMSQRIKASGHVLVYNPLAKAVHMRRDNISSLLRTNWNWYRTFHEPVSFSNIIFRTRYNLRKSKERINEDLQHRYLKLLPLEIIFSFDQFRRDVQYYLKNHQ